jgi:hypothetical protein
MVGYQREELVGRHVETILTVGSRIFYQTHLFPLIALHGHAEEMFLLLQPRGDGDLGALVNAVRRERAGHSVIDCVLMPVRERRKFEMRCCGPRKRQRRRAPSSETPTLGSSNRPTSWSASEQSRRTPIAPRAPSWP